MTNTIDFTRFTPADWTAFYCDQADILVRRAERETHEGKRESLYRAAADLYADGARIGTWPTQVVPTDPALSAPTYAEIVTCLDTAVHGWADGDLDYS